MKWRKVLPLLTPLFFLIGFASCVTKVKREFPVDFRASTGMAVYENEAYRWVATTLGPVELEEAWVTKGVITDDYLAAENSDIAGLKVGTHAWIKNSTVRGSAQIGTIARFYDSQVQGQLTVGEDLDAHDSIFYGPVTVGGLVTAICSNFEQELAAPSEIICLSGSETKTIRVYSCGLYYDPQVVRLSEGSQVKGDIIFESGRGRVVIDASSKLHGKIYGGQIIHPFKYDG